MQAITVYDEQGKILFSYSSSEEEILDMKLKNPLNIDGIYDYKNQYILNEVATLRPEFPITINKSTLTPDGIDFIEFNSIPANCSIQIKGLSTGYYYSDIATSPQETFSTNVADSYVITISKFPYIDFKVTIDANS